MSTKEKIITTATKVFNEKGFHSINLRELAQEIGISRGNLTYHFGNKKELLAAIVKEMWEKVGLEKNKTMQMPSFGNMHNQTQRYYKIQKEYAFVFLDTHVQNHPIVRNQFKAIIEKTIEDFHRMIAMGIQIGTVKEEAIPGTYRSLALSVWMVSFYWLSQQTTRDKMNEEDSEKAIWGLILPHLTEKGVLGFKEFFGDNFYEKLGEPFNVNQYAIVKF